ncbi:MAG: pentapeptide repeat-containing protein, partial [Ruminococcus sp.]|nr:pentapeptide repeat-containing protein [Ruminococcus sp.]
RGVSIKKEDIEIPQYLAMFHFARQGNDGTGIEFAHKTVYEYFTAVKLYEDYFAEITADYPENFEKKTDAYGNEITPLENVWTNIIEAFRYKSIDDEDIIIFNYLNEMERSVYNGKSDDNSQGFDFKTFESYFVEGIEQQVLSELSIKKAVKEYKVKKGLFIEKVDIISQFDLLTTQISCAFCNLTWFLTGHGYCNEDDNMACKRFKELVSIRCGNLNLKNWRLSGAYLIGVNLGEADLSGANLYNANLCKAYLSEANLIEANLSGAYLYKADLYKADLRGADLNGADLSEADLSEATYCLDKRCETKFPDGFNPKDHDMIEVDISGNPVK